MSGWIGVDLDGTLAKYNGWQGPLHIGEPIQPMLDRVKNWLLQGIEVRIVTARVSWIEDNNESLEQSFMCRYTIDKWCEQWLGKTLLITNEKDYGMLELWDDRCKQVVPNTGESVEQNYLNAIGLVLEQNAEIKRLNNLLKQQDESRIKLANSC